MKSLCRLYLRGIHLCLYIHTYTVYLYLLFIGTYIYFLCMQNMPQNPHTPPVPNPKTHSCASCPDSKSSSPPLLPEAEGLRICVQASGFRGFPPSSMSVRPPRLSVSGRGTVLCRFERRRLAPFCWGVGVLPLYKHLYLQETERMIHDNLPHSWCQVRCFPHMAVERRRRHSLCRNDCPRCRGMGFN